MQYQEQTLQTQSFNKVTLPKPDLTALLSGEGGAVAIILAIAILLRSVAEIIKALMQVRHQSERPDRQ